MRKFILILLLFVLSPFLGSAQSQSLEDEWKSLERPLNFYMANDLGRNGYYDQKPIAALMGQMAETIDIECVLAAGDVHHFEGVRSVNDPLWMTNFELIYDHPELMIPWYAVAGNHEYRSNTQAIIDYSSVSARWNAPSKYYTMVMENDGVEVRIVMLDTTPLIDKYRKDTEDYHDASEQDIDAELKWLDSVLASAKEQWVIVVGHHPIYADTDKNVSERKDMQERVDKILRRHDNVDMYLCGHIHNFQHIRVKGSDIDYVVNSSGSLARDVKPVDGTVFCSGLSGFSLITADKDELSLHMIDNKGNVIHTVTRRK